jgi:hypothetical protein
MPIWSWILMWLVVIAVVAFFAIREIRSGRRRTAEVDRSHHAAVREAGANFDGRGPNGGVQTWMS